MSKMENIFSAESIRRATRAGSPEVASGPGMVSMIWHGEAWVFTPEAARRIASDLQQAAIDATEPAPTSR